MTDRRDFVFTVTIYSLRPEFNSAKLKREKDLHNDYAITGIKGVTHERQAFKADLLCL